MCLPHDWLTWRLAGAPGLDALRTDRSDASGTGYWSAATGEYRRDLLRVGASVGTIVLLPQVLGPTGRAGHLRTGAPLGPGAGDNAAAALGVGAEPGDVIVSIGTSGIVSTVSDVPAADASGIVAGFADTTGRFLPVVVHAQRRPGAGRGRDHAAGGPRGAVRAGAVRPAGRRRAGPGARTWRASAHRTARTPPERVHGLTLRTSTPAHLARAAVEGMLCALADGLDAMIAQGATVNRVVLVGGGARSEAVRRIAPAVFGCPVLVPTAGGVRRGRRRPPGGLGAVGRAATAGVDGRAGRGVRGRRRAGSPRAVRRGPRKHPRPR